MTGIITKIVRIIGSDAEPETINAQVNVNMQSGGNPFQEVELAVRQAQREHIQRYVKPLLHITRKKAWVLEAIEITALSHRARELVRMMQQNWPLNDRDLRDWIKDKCPSENEFFKTDYLEQVSIGAKKDTAKDSSPDAYEQALQTGSTSISSPDWDIKLIGDWKNINILPRVLRPIQLVIEDGNGRRVIRKPELPATLGRSEQADIPIKGTYASGRHAKLTWRGDRAVFTDIGSSNGSFTGAERLATHTPLQIKTKTHIRLGARWDDSSTERDCPRITIEPIDQSDQPRDETQRKQDGTPIKISSTPLQTQSTPVSAGKPALAYLQSGTGRIAVTRLPFHIGRSHDQEWRTPELNAAVSGRHLELIEITNQGIAVEDHGKNGTYRQGRCYRHERFVWRWNEELILGGPNVDDEYHPLAVTLQKARPTEAGE